MGPVAERVHDLVEPLVSGSGLELVDVEHGPGLLKITLDREGGIDLDTITEASERISDLLDVHDVVPGRYTLEVTSPGLERPLRDPRHYKRFVGTPIVIRTVFEWGGAAKKKSAEKPSNRGQKNKGIGRK